MDKVAVIFRSKSGYTEKYANWIADELSTHPIKAENVKLNDLLNYDVIIYGGGLYAGGINGLKLIKKNLKLLSDKKIIVFATGATPVREEIVKEISDKNFDENEQKQIKFFLLRGGFDYGNLNLFDKFLMNILKAMLKSKKTLTADERGLLNSYENPVDFTNKKYIEPIIEEIKSL